MKLGKYFTLRELTVTDTGFINKPSKKEEHNLRLLVQHVLDPLRELYGKPITINSGYRSPLVNKKIGGVPTSEHVKGMAADITAGSKEENKKLFELIKNNIPAWRQLINEHDYQWLHISFNISDNKKQILSIK